MSAARSDLMPNISVIPIGSQAASIVLPGMKFPKHSRIKSVSVIDQAGVAADATNHVEVKLEDLSGNVLASLDSAAGALVANTPSDLAINTNAAGYSSHGELEVAAGSGVKVEIVKHGTGVPTLAVIQVEWYPV